MGEDPSFVSLENGQHKCCTRENLEEAILPISDEIVVKWNVFEGPLS